MVDHEPAPVGNDEGDDAPTFVKSGPCRARRLSILVSAVASDEQGEEELSHCRSAIASFQEHGVLLFEDKEGHRLLAPMPLAPGVARSVRAPWPALAQDLAHSACDAPFLPPIR